MCAHQFKCCARVRHYIPHTVEHGLLLGGRLGDWSFGAHYLPLVLLFACLAVFDLIGFGSAILS